MRRSYLNTSELKKLVRLFLKALLPSPLTRVIREKRLVYARRRFSSSWDRAAKTAKSGREDSNGGLLIFPSDPSEIVGAVGDDAMISAALAHYRAKTSDLKVAMLCHPGAPEAIVRSCGFEPVIIPSLGAFPEAMSKLFEEGNFRAFIGLGADVMDGYYNPDFAAQMLAAADLAARSGLQSIILGFSFNNNAAISLRSAFARVDHRVSLNVRDCISLERLQAFAPVKARLVADSAFMLEPSGLDSSTKNWIITERASGRRIIGLNLHPMFIRNPEPEQIQKIVATMTTAVRKADALADPPISWILIPHDYRDASGHGDGVCLRPLMEQLSHDAALHLRYFEGIHRAATLKDLAGRVDGIITGRMHLAIASLGMGVPVMCLTYQDKFEGLFHHFQLPGYLLLSPATLENETNLSGRLHTFLADLPELTHQVQSQIPQVLALSALNFEPVKQAQIRELPAETGVDTAT